MGALVAVLLLALIGGCSSSSSHSGTTQGQSTTVAQGSVTVPAHHFVQVPLTVNASGTLTLQINYAVPSDIVVTGISTANCSGAVSSASCSFLSFTETPTSSTPSKTVTASGTGAGSYVVTLGNLGSADESVSYLATLASS